MAGANFILDKGYILEGSTAYTAFRFVAAGATDTSVTSTIAAGALALGVIQEDVDAAKVATGKVAADVRILGISKVTAGAAVTLWAEVVTDTSGRAVNAATSTHRVLGRALQSAAAAGDIIDVLLVPCGRVMP
jgi:hypothetical protein